jgi:Fur family ferric uptake transcriptional regulator
MNRAILETPMAAALRAKGYKLTAPRQAVMQVLANGGQLLSPAEIHARGKAIYPALGLTTVYRTLDLLTELGFLRPAYLGDNQQHYAAHTEGHHHHLVCSGCGTVLEVDQCNLAELIEELRARTDFQIDGHYVEFFGLCPKCQHKDKE